MPKYNSIEYNLLEEPLKERIDMLRECAGKWSPKRDDQEVKACLVAQKLSKVEGKDHSEYYNSYNANAISVYISDHEQLFEETFGKGAEIKDRGYINHMAELLRTRQAREVMTFHLYADHKRIPEEMADEYEKLSTLRDLQESNATMEERVQDLRGLNTPDKPKSTSKTPKVLKTPEKRDQLPSSQLSLFSQNSLR